MKKIIIALVTFASVMALALPVQAMQIAGAGLCLAPRPTPTPTPEPFPDPTPHPPKPIPRHIGGGGGEKGLPSTDTPVTVERPSPPTSAGDPVTDPYTVAPQLSVYWHDGSRIFIGTDNTGEILPVMDALEKYLHNPKILKKIVNLLITRHAAYGDQEYDDLLWRWSWENDDKSTEKLDPRPLPAPASAGRSISAAPTYDARHE